MFSVYKRDVADVNPTEYLPGAALTIKLGMAVKLAANAITKAGASDIPTHVVIGKHNSDGNFPVLAVNDNTYFIVETSATVSETNVGDVVTIDADGLRVTATTAGGVFRITKFIDANTVVGKFVSAKEGA